MQSTLPSLNPVLITGGCGFIGYHLIRHLYDVDSTSKIHILDLDISRNRIETAEYHQCDIADHEHVKTIMQPVRPRTIFHIAGPDSMIILPELFEKVKLLALVFTSTSSVIHDNVSDLIDADESLPTLRPPIQKRVYTLTKAAAEKAVIDANRTAGDSSMLTASIRPVTTIGERDTITLGKMALRAKEGKMRYQMGNGKNLYDVVYVGNLVDAHILATQALVKAYGKPTPPAQKKVDGETFNVTNGERILFWDLIRRIAAAVGRPVKEADIVVIPVWFGLTMAWCSELVAKLRGLQQPVMTVEAVRFSTINRTPSMEKAQRLLDYRPQVSIDEAI